MWSMRVEGGESSVLIVSLSACVSCLSAMSFRPGGSWGVVLGPCAGGDPTDGL